MEVQTRTKVAFRARSFDDGQKATAEALTDLAMFVEDKNQSTHILSQVGHDARVCGLGWHEFDVQDGVILEARANPLTVIPDLSDMTPGMSNQRYAGKVEWMTKEEAKLKFPDRKAEIDAASNWTFLKPFAGPAYERSALCNGYYDDSSQEIMVVEWFMREPCKYYEVIDTSDRLVNFFDKAEAYANARKRPGTRQKDVAVKHGFKVVIVYFTGEVLLGTLEDGYQLNPAKGLFLLTPVVCFRENNTGIPFGLVRNAKDPQRRYNKTKTRMTWLMATHQVIMEGDAADADKVRKEAARPDGVLLKKSNKELSINRHETAISQHAAILESDDRDIQVALGIFDESMGVETNASSGVAIQKRQLGSNRNMAMIIDNALAMKKRWAEKLLYLIQTVFTDQTALWVTDDKNEVKTLVLNQPQLDSNGKPAKDKNGNPIVTLDIRTGVYDVYVEEVPDVATQQEYARELVLKAMQTAGGLQGLTPGLLELLGVPQSAKLMDEVNKGLPQQMAAQNAANENAAKGLPTAPMAPTGMPGGGGPTLQPTQGLAA
jgi:hypothetical protein